LTNLRVFRNTSINNMNNMQILEGGQNQDKLAQISKVTSTDLDLAARQLWDILVSEMGHFDTSEIEFVELAFMMMVQRHNTQRRKSGEFYITHPVSAAIILLELNPDKETLAAMLLHDVPEDTYDKPEEGIKEIEKLFGAETAFLVSGITKLGVLKYRGEQRYVENLRKMFVTMSKDLRVMFIKLSDRLHNLMTLDALPPEKSHRIALESIEIYAPLAERLGMSNFRSRIEDLAFPFVYPDKYEQFIKDTELQLEKRLSKVSGYIVKTEEILKAAKVDYYYVVGRAKRYYSVYKKLELKDHNLDKIYDLVALRIVTKSISDCYEIMSLLHDYFRVLEHRTKDYIKNPKENGYQSIHMVVEDPTDGEIFEFQIRTKRMHIYAEFGVASHWSYKSKKHQPSSNLVQSLLSQQNLQWVNQLLELSTQKMTNEDYLKHIKLNLFPNRIFVLTPKGDVIDLPKGSSVLDFAFKIHEFIGGHATGAKVNGKMSKLNTVLQNGDTVEILTAKNQKPNKDWLNWVKTPSATKHIKSMLRKIGINLPVE
jgi:GTP diphosphokinase / guanosine-3',5'-bis(diphosphate) 3'-diphosphatase